MSLFLDLTQDGELEPYASLVEPPARYVNMPIRDFSVPTRDGLVVILDEIDAELDTGGLVFVHCWAGCGRTGVVVGSWLVRHGADPERRAPPHRRGARPRLPADPRAAVFVLEWQREPVRRLPWTSERGERRRLR